MVRQYRITPIHEGELKSSYGDYLLASFSPFAAPGVHVILDAPADSMSAEYFSRASDELAAKLFRAYKRESPHQTQAMVRTRGPAAGSDAFHPGNHN